MERYDQRDDLFDGLPERELDELTTLVRNTVRQVVDSLARQPALAQTLPDGGPKPFDVDDEHRQRTDWLRRVRAGQLADALIADVVAGCAAQDAADAVWLGASLADLGAATGNSRQAARKRWPDLGAIHRTRRWVSGHHEDLLTVLRTLVDRAAELTAPPDAGKTLDRAIRALRQALRAARLDADSGSVLDPATGRPARWRRLARAVDVDLRTVVGLATPETPAAGGALDGARGVLAHHDAIVAADR